MKNLFLSLTLLFAFSFASVGLATAADDKSFSGEVMDAACAKAGSHDAMMKKEGAKDAKECTLTCAKMGSKLVLYDSATKKVYQLDNQDKAKDFAGQHVTVKGDLKGKTIKVEDIAPAS